MKVAYLNYTISKGVAIFVLSEDKNGKMILNQTSRETNITPQKGRKINQKEVVLLFNYILEQQDMLVGKGIASLIIRTNLRKVYAHISRCQKYAEHRTKNWLSQEEKELLGKFVIQISIEPPTNISFVKKYSKNVEEKASNEILDGEDIVAIHGNM